MPTVNHTVTVTLNGTDRTSLLIKDSLYIRSSIGNDADTAQFTLRGNNAYTPNGWHTVSIAVNGTTVFGGYIVAKEARGVGDGTNKEARWAVTCRDWSVLFDQTIVDYGYADTDDTAILSDLFSRYLSSDGFDAATNVTNVADALTIYFENLTLRAALHQLADQCGADWHIAPDKSLYWYATSSPASAAFNIDTVSPNDSTSFDVLKDSLEVSTDETQIINRVTVIGGDQLLPGTSDVFSANGTKTRFALSYKPTSIDFVSYIIGGTAYYARSDDIGIAPGDKLRYEGGSFDVVANLQNRFVTVRNTAGSAPDNSTGVVVRYYPTQAAGTTINSTSSQGEYGRVFAYTVYDEKLTTNDLAADYGQRIIDEYAFGRQTITFAVTEHGLLPGRLITLNVPTLEVEPTTTDRLETEDRENLAQESGDWLLLESSGSAWTFLIQEVEIYPTVSQQDEFMIVARVRCGKYIPSLFDTLKSISGATAGPGLTPARRQVGKLSNVANDLGEIRAGRAVLTDGGTAAFDWSNYASHTGVVLGLEDNSGNGQGAMYVLDGGTVRAKIGKMDGLGSVGTVAPSGWGIWTSNGYFTGTVTGAYVTGGTVQGAGGSITLTPSRLTMIVGTAFSFGTPTLLHWQGTAGGTVAQMGATLAGGTADFYTVVGTSGAPRSTSTVRTYGTAGGASGDYSELIQRNNILTFDMIRNGIQLTTPIVVGAGSVVTGGSVYPATTGIYDLGGSANAWNALWLQSPNGTKYKVTVSNAGALVVT